MTFIIIFKILVGISLVLFLVYLSEKVSPKIAGIIGGTAIGGTAVSLFFFGFEHGAGFVQQAIPWTIAGLGSEIMFYLGYYFGGKIVPNKFGLFWQMLSAIFFSFLFFFSLGYLLSIIDFTLLTGVLAFSAIYLIVNFIFRNIRNRSFLCVHKTTFWEFIFRIIIVSGLIIFITSVPLLLGNRWAGLFSAFATTTFPVLLILHYKHGSDALNTVIKNISWSLSSLVVYIIGVYYLYEIIGVYYGTLVSFVISFVFLLILKFVYVKIDMWMNKSEYAREKDLIEQMNNLWIK